MNRPLQSTISPDFKSIKTYEKGDLRKLLNTISPSSLSLILSIHCYSEDLHPGWLTGGPEHDSINKNFHNLNQLKELYFTWTKIKLPPTDLQCFSAFKNSLSCISLCGCSVSTSVLVALINYFPKLETLILGLLSPLDSDEAPLSLDPSRRSLSKLKIDQTGPTYISPGCLGVVEKLSELGLRFDDICILPPSPDCLTPKLANNIVHLFGTNVKCLRLPQIEVKGSDGVDLSSCLNLQVLELETLANEANDKGIQAITSIQSNTMQKVIIKRKDQWGLPTCQVHYDFWTNLDKILFEFVTRPMHKNRLNFEVPGFRGDWSIGGRELYPKETILDLTDLEKALFEFVTPSMYKHRPKLEVEFRKDWGIGEGKLYQKDTILPKFVEQGGLITVC